VIATRFAYPVGQRRGDPYLTHYVASKFLDIGYYTKNDIWHPGNDWNGIIPEGEGPDWDLGQPVYCVGNGTVKEVAWFSVWGNVVVIEHILPDGQKVWSQYAHLDQVLPHILPGRQLFVDSQLGTIGKGDPAANYAAHLHFEIRRLDLPANAWEPRVSNRLAVKEAYHDPEIFIKIRQNEAPGDDMTDFYLRANQLYEMYQNGGQQFVDGTRWGVRGSGEYPHLKVRTIEADVAQGEWYWEAIGVHRLLPDFPGEPRENGNNHHVYALTWDEDTNRIQGVWYQWTWEGKSGGALRLRDDKPQVSHELPSIDMGCRQFVEIWVSQQSLKSDRIKNLRPDWPTMVSGQTELCHHSTMVLFMKRCKGQVIEPPPIEPPTQPPTQPPPIELPPQGALEGQLVASSSKVIDDNAARTRFEITQIFDVKKK